MDIFPGTRICKLCLSAWLKRSVAINNSGSLEKDFENTCSRSDSFDLQPMLFPRFLARLLLVTMKISRPVYVLARVQFLFGAH